MSLHNSPNPTTSIEQQLRTLNERYQQQLQEISARNYPQGKPNPSTIQPRQSLLRRIVRQIVDALDFISVLKREAYVKEMYNASLQYNQQRAQIVQKVLAAPPTDNLAHEAFILKQLLPRFGGVLVENIQVPLDKNEQQISDELTLQIILRTIELIKDPQEDATKLNRVGDFIRQTLAQTSSAVAQTPKKIAQSLTINNSQDFAEHTLEMLNELDPHAMVIQLRKGTNDAHHSMGLIKEINLVAGAEGDNIWLVDTNRFAICVPAKNFTAFFVQYLERNYPDYHNAGVQLIAPTQQLRPIKQPKMDPALREQLQTRPEAFLASQSSVDNKPAPSGPAPSPAAPKKPTPKAGG